MKTQQLVFICIASLVMATTHLMSPLGLFWEVAIAMVLFFGLGIPHGALDLTLGKLILKPQFGNKWLPLFLLGYLTVVSLIIILWVLFPLPSFLFFLAISVVHFGFSDRLTKNPLEGIARGILPISAPAFFYPSSFQSLLESSLSLDSATFVLTLCSTFFYPCITLIALLIVIGLVKQQFLMALELGLLSLLFITLSPFMAFLIYFCFLHSLRHIHHVFEELNLSISFKSVQWMFLQSLPSTLTTFMVLMVVYLTFKQGTLDLNWMMNLFFISLAALTFPHMILVEAVKRKV